MPAPAAQPPQAAHALPALLAALHGGAATAVGGQQAGPRSTSVHLGGGKRAHRAVKASKLQEMSASRASGSTSQYDPPF